MIKVELAGAVILNTNKEILLMHRNTEQLKQWELPGGKLEKGELPEQTAIRELKEELNIEIEIEKYLGYKEFEDNETILKYHWYKCRILRGSPELVEEKFDNLKYFNKKELEGNRELSSNMKVFISYIDIEKYND